MIELFTHLINLCNSTICIFNTYTNTTKKIFTQGYSIITYKGTKERHFINTVITYRGNYRFSFSYN